MRAAKGDEKGRGPRKGLDPETVVRAALAVLDEDGVDGLTVRRIAERLGVQNPALYWHFRDKQAIVDRMAEAMLASAVVEHAPGQDWREWLRATALAFRGAMTAHRDGARVMASADLSKSPMTPNVERALSVLTAAGFQAKDALFGILAVFDYTLGATFEEQADPIRKAPKKEPPASDAHEAPRLVAALSAMGEEMDSQETYEGGLDILLDGLATRRQESGKAARGRPAVTGSRKR